LARSAQPSGVLRSDAATTLALRHHTSLRREHHALQRNAPVLVLVNDDIGDAKIAIVRGIGNGFVAIRRSAWSPRLTASVVAALSRRRRSRLDARRERNDHHEKPPQRDPASALSLGHHAALRAMVRRIRLESAQSGRDDARTRRVRRSFQYSSLGHQAVAVGWRSPSGNGSANAASARVARVGASTRRTSSSVVRTGTGIAPLTSNGTPSTSC